MSDSNAGIGEKSYTFFNLTLPAAFTSNNQLQYFEIRQDCSTFAENKTT